MVLQKGTIGFLLLRGNTAVLYTEEISQCLYTEETSRPLRCISLALGVTGVTPIQRVSMVETLRTEGNDGRHPSLGLTV